MSQNSFEENKIVIDRMKEVIKNLYNNSQFSKILYISGENIDSDLI